MIEKNILIAISTLIFLFQFQLRYNERVIIDPTSLEESASEDSDSIFAVGNNQQGKIFLQKIQNCPFPRNLQNLLELLL